MNHPSTLIVLSAKDSDRLVERTSDLLGYLTAGTAEEANQPRLLDIAFTLQIGREPMEERVAFLADTLESAIQKLTLFVTGAPQITGLYRGCISSEVLADPAWQTNDTVNGVPEEPIRSGDLNKLAAWWVAGGEPDWQSLYEGLEPRRISLPTYRFARERCWFNAGETNDALINQEQNQNSETIGERAPNDRILNEIRQLLASVLKLSPARIGPRQSMAEWGLDSVTTVAFLRELEQKYSIQVSVSSLIEYQTLESLVGFLSEHYFEALQSGAKNELGVPGDSNGSAALVKMSGFHDNGLNGGSTDDQENGTGLADRKKAPRTMALGSLDYLFVGPRRFAIQVLYHFEPHLNFVRLQAGLRTVAEAFYPINSHLVRHRDEYQVSECADDPDFTEIFCDEHTMPPIQDRPETFAPFLVQFDPRLPGEKLAKFRLFQLASGSLLSVNVSHAIADGYSFYYFLSSWAAACRGESFSPPDHALRAFNRPGRHSLLEVDKANSHDFGELDFSFPFLEAGFDPTTSRVETLHFDGASLLSEARDAADETSRHKITENSLLTALVWQAYARALSAEAGELVLACPIDFRRLSPELSPSFFGNASAPALLRLERKLVLAESVAALAAMISDAIRRCDELTLARYKGAIDHLRRVGGLEATENVALVDPRNGLIVTNVARFPLPPIDFGTGPFRREFTPTNYAGTAVIVGGEGSTLKVRLSLPDLPSR
ncbi:MAG TPA: acyltransferase [Chthoniobacterales bacterium]